MKVSKSLYEFIEDFEYEDLFNADMRNGLQKIFNLLARIYFEDLYNTDLSSLEQLVNAQYFELAKEKLYGIKAKD